MPDVVEDEPSDLDLVRRMARRDTAALEVIYVRHAEFVRRILVRYARDLGAHEVPDLCQEVFLSVYDAAPRYHDSGKFRAWLCGIALRKARQLRERGRRRVGLLERWGWSGPTGGAIRRTPEEEATSRLMLERALERLSDPQREILLLHTVEQMSGAEIAVALGIKLKTVWTRLHRARQAMLRLLEPPPVEPLS